MHGATHALPGRVSGHTIELHQNATEVHVGERRCPAKVQLNRTIQYAGQVMGSARAERPQYARLQVVALHGQFQLDAAAFTRRWLCAALSLDVSSRIELEPAVF